MRHPSLEELALWAGGELPWWKKPGLSWHLKRCTSCRSQADKFVHLRSWLEQTAQGLPEGVDWDRLAAEMAANIRLGLAAGECVGEPARSPSSVHRWIAVASAALMLVVGVMWWLHVPRTRPAVRSTEPDIVVQVTGEGIELKGAHGAMTLIVPRREAFVAASSAGSVSASYLDEQTGLVVVSDVYLH